MGTAADKNNSSELEMQEFVDIMTIASYTADKESGPMTVVKMLAYKVEHAWEIKLINLCFTVMDDDGDQLLQQAEFEKYLPVFDTHEGERVHFVDFDRDHNDGIDIGEFEWALRCLGHNECDLE